MAAEGGGAVKSMDTDSMQISTKVENAFQVIIIGDSGVGKTSIILRFVKDMFYEKVSEAGYVSDFVKEVDVSGRKVKLHVWDTAGLERYTSITDSYYSKANAVLIVYDCCDQRSFSSIDKWYNEIVRYLANKLDDGMPVVIVGNKKDKLKHIMATSSNYVDIKRAEDKANKEGLMCMETSAKSGENILKLFTTVAKSLADSHLPPFNDGSDEPPHPDGKCTRNC